ncbi:aminoacyl-tRNA deacylase [Methylophaga pinxianii]|uniref:aminoacyl-tRNA deacylase n=1 Tax=Methylophaga pinxianii TaxID=2881052 RepID=UPI001CF526FE|nr:YbaK/EbsC family protein [Methylophaga pinxianii]MCB2428353.1 YbaK/EbsC family protein [Methylophaga pinxianii]UPH45290.1 YbaK/EbsC family protein [Methylophaga pinxianii]
MSQRISSPVTELLTQHTINFEVIEIPLSEDKKPIRNLEELLSSQGRDPNSVVRSLLFKTGSDTFVLLAVAGGGRADWAALRKQVGEKKLRMAEFDEVSAATGYVVGAVPPIALPEAVTVLADNSAFQFDQVIIGSGVLGYALALNAKDLQEIMSDVPVSDFVKA